MDCPDIRFRGRGLEAFVDHAGQVVNGCWRIHAVSVALLATKSEGFNQVVTSMSYTLLYSSLRTDRSMSEREDSDACMSPMPE